MHLEDLERQLRDRLDVLGPAPRAELLHVVMLPDYDRAARIWEFYGDPSIGAFAELLISLRSHPTLKPWSEGKPPSGRSLHDRIGGVLT